MKIKIKIPNSLQQKTDGESSIDVECDSIGECLETLVRRYPLLQGEILDTQGVLLLKWMVVVNERICRTSELPPPLKKGDVIVLAPVIAGG